MGGRGKGRRKCGVETVHFPLVTTVCEKDRKLNGARRVGKPKYFVF